jgi:hypothetical protein
VLGHKYRADSLSYFLLEAAKEALGEVITASMEGPKTLHELHQHTLQALAPPPHSHRLPAPVACDKEVCLSDPKCFTNFEPRVQNDLLARVVPTRALTAAALSPGPGSASSKMPPLSLAALLPADWTYDISWFDKGGVQKSADDHRGYLDKKFILRSNFTGSGPLTEADAGSVLTFLVEPSLRGPLWLCQVQKGFLKYPSSDSELDVGARLTLTAHAPALSEAGAFTRGMNGAPSPALLC